MSISTQGGEQRRPSTVSTGKKPAAGKPGGKSATPRPAGGGKGGKTAGGGKGRKPVTPVKVTQGRNWGPIALFVAVGVLAVGIIGYGAYAVSQGSKPWEERAAGIDGIVNYRDNPDASLTAREHQQGPIEYTLNPPVGGKHNNDWQNCMGNVYPEPIANEHAVHSLEHGAVWLAYRQGLPADQVEQLASKIRGQDFTMMSPVEGLDSTVSMQAWGYQLKVDDVNDGRIDDFISALRINASVEPGVACSGGITATGTSPRDLQPQQPGS